MAETAPPTAPDILYCTVHPSVQTSLRCNKCGRPMCVKCARRTPVGYRCKECVSNQQAVFFTAQPLDPLIQVVVSALLSVVGAGIIGVLLGGIGFGFVTFIVALPASAFAGGLIADVAHRAAGRRHGKYSWLAVGAGIVLGALAVGAVPFLLSLLTVAVAGDQGGSGVVGALLGMGLRSIAWWIYVVVATGTGAGRLRLGR